MDHPQMIYTPMLGIIFLPLLIIGVGVGIAALAGSMRSKPKSSFTFDSTPTQIAERGSFIPYVMGRTRIGGSVFAWAGNRTVVQEGASGGKKGFGGGSSNPGTTVYRESGWHILCIGPGYSLFRIWQGGNLIFNDGSINADTTPSGTTITLPKNEGSFRIYWGEEGQPTDPLLTADVATAANMHGVVSIVWDQKRLGGSPTWPQIDYEVAIMVQPAYRVFGSDHYFSGGTPDTSSYFEGANGAHVLNQLLTAPAPWGVGIPSGAVSESALITMGTALRNEGLPTNFVVRNGDNAQQIVADMLLDLGVVLPDVGGILTPLLIRPVLGVTAVPADSVVAPEPETDFLSGDLPPDSLVFTYPDFALNYKKGDIRIDDDGSSDLRGRGKLQTVDMPTITNRAAGVLVSNRRQAELLSGIQTLTFKVMRSARNLVPGQPISIAGYDPLRVTGVTRADDSANVVVEAMKDVYSLAPIDYFPPDPVFRPPSPAVAADTLIEWVEIPYVIIGRDGPAIAVLRERANATATGALVWFSPDGASYVQIGSQISPANTGVLIDAMPQDGDRVIEYGPTLTLESIDADRFVDLSGADARWRSGEQMMFLEGEILFVRKLEAMGGSTWRLRGVIRCRVRSPILDHAATARFWVVRGTDITPFGSPLLIPGSSLSVKTQPYDGFGDVVDLSLCPAVTHDITGQFGSRFAGMVGNLSSLGLRAGYDADFDRRNVWRSGEDVRFTWTAAVKNGLGGAAGEQPAGTVCIPPTLPEGVFTVWIYKVVMGTPTLVRTVGTPDLFYDYPNATMVADCGGEPDELRIEMVQSTGGATSSFLVAITMERI